MVHKHVWEAAGMTAGFLCIGCLEARLGPPTMPRRFHERTDQQSRRPMAYASPRRATYLGSPRLPILRPFQPGGDRRLDGRTERRVHARTSAGDS
jgi:hypothetical protein